MGLVGQTATAVRAPSQVVSKLRYRPLVNGTKTSWVYVLRDDFLDARRWCFTSSPIEHLREHGKGAEDALNGSTLLV